MDYKLSWKKFGIYFLILIALFNPISVKVTLRILTILLEMLLFILAPTGPDDLLVWPVLVAILIAAAISMRFRIMLGEFAFGLYRFLFFEPVERKRKRKRSEDDVYDLEELFGRQREK